VRISLDAKPSLPVLKKKTKIIEKKQLFAYPHKRKATSPKNYKKIYSIFDKIFAIRKRLKQYLQAF